MQENKSIVEEALIQMRNVEEAIAQNAKGILASTMKEEINQLVKESLSEQDEVDLDAEIDVDDTEDDGICEASPIHVQCINIRHNKKSNILYQKLF